MQQRHNHQLRWLFSVLVTFGLAGGLAGCGDDPPPQQPAKPAEKPAKPAEKKPAPKPKADSKKDDKKPEEDTEYKRPEFPENGRRDPFVFTPPAPTPAGPGDPEVRIMEPLEQYELGQLTLVAIITGTPVPKAMFLDPTNFGHIAKESDRVGKDGGRITDIRSNEVEVTINSVGGLGTVADLEDQSDGPKREPGEPVTVVIRLTDTDIVLPDLEDEDAPKSVVDQLEEKPPPKPGDAPPKP